MKRLIDIDWDRVSELDWARLAAYIDGEGCITISNFTERRQQFMKVFVANTDRRLMEWCRNTFGGTIQGKTRLAREHHKPCYTWTVCSQMAWIVLLCAMPYLIIKKEQAEVALAFQRTMTRKGKWLDGGRGRTTDETRKFRDWCYSELRRLKDGRLFRTLDPSAPQPTT